MQIGKKNNMMWCEMFSSCGWDLHLIFIMHLFFAVEFSLFFMYVILEMLKEHSGPSSIPKNYY